MDDPHDPVLALSITYLEKWTAQPARTAEPSDAGIPVLAHQVAATGGPDAEATASRAVAVWARTAGRGPGHPGLYDSGLAGTLVGLRLGARLHPVLYGAADRLRDHLTGASVAAVWRTKDVGFSDYDLITGPAGILLALCAGTDSPTPATATSHLQALCDHDDLPRLRTGQYADHPHLSWTHGRVNTGMGHGVAGVLTALTAALRRTGDPATAAALRRAVRWLITRSYVDERGIRTWPGAGDGTPPSGANPRQAWCYGTPGIAWALWDAADALGDHEAADRALEAFMTLTQRYDEQFHLFGDGPADILGLCHGAAGVLAVADAFDRHARLPVAAALSARLAAHLRTRLPDALATPWSPALLTGAPGALSALLTARGGPRDWLPCLGLR
ncbi:MULTISPECIES: lanthionine synthetase LanC family protein [Streptomyces]|uniref:lanthionine synthetase LanC family protein n=1 Tax=Streptomyces TaxID=1883 RepID=UPI001E290DD0|nr:MULTISPECIES: lanthionine synthetase LanC family protein [Streptomyces]UFQ19319.1 subtilin biosynthesis protein spaC [Streptomyces huasconensis]WCL88939.1 subtilin biosynthesis protein spaC [Streptomyces sp. JCM 35825]